MTKELTIEELVALAAKMEDQSVTKAHVEYEPPPAGVTFGRFIGYIELGKQPQRPFKGKAKPDAEEVRLVFELLHAKKNRHEYETPEGEKKVRYDQISLRMTKQFGTKAKYKKLFNAMTYGREIKHMAQMLGEAFLITVVHNTVAATADKPARVFANIYDDEGKWLVGKARVIADPVNDPDKYTDVPVPPAQSPLQVFFWNNPTKATWDSLYIDGTRTIKKGDEEVEVSKNWLQEIIVSAKNYAGSALDQLLGGIDLPMGGALLGAEDLIEDDDEREALKAEPKPVAKPKTDEFEMTGDAGEDVPFVPDAPTVTQPSATTAASGVAAASVSSPSEEEDPDEKAMREAAERIAAKKAAAVALAKGASVAPAASPAKSTVDADLAALGLV